MKTSELEGAAAATSEVTVNRECDDDTLPNWGIHFHPAGPLFVDRNSLFFVRLSAEATRVALQLARTGDLGKAARLRAPGDPSAARVIEVELREALATHPVTASWLEGELDSGLRVTGSSRSFLPLSASLQLTNGCNLSCSFCYASSGPKMDDELDAGTWIDVVERLSAAGVAAVTLTGGEPTIARDFRSVLAVASLLIDSVDVFSNGLGWSSSLVDFVAACGNVRVQISIDGLDVTHDSLRGRPGAYRRSLQTISRLHDAGVPVMVSMTVTPANSSEVAAVAHEVAAAGATLFRAGATLPIGRAGAPGEDTWSVSEKLVAAQFDSLGSLPPSIEMLGWGSCGDASADVQQAEFGDSELPTEFLTPGFLHWHVRADGMVTPCQVDDQPFGDIRCEDMATIGSPERLEAARRQPRDCRCMSKVDEQEVTGERLYWMQQ